MIIEAVGEGANLRLECLRLAQATAANTKVGTTRGLSAGHILEIAELYYQWVVAPR